MFYHAFNNYMDIAFPMDELDPLRCTGKGPDRWNPQNLGVNDVLGDYLLTLIDSLDMLAVMHQVINDRHSFTRAVHLIIKHLPSFDINSRVQVFESNIRILGGLISGHLIASTDFFPNMKIKGYNNELLDLAKDLGERLLKAWKTPTGIPFARVNLRYGVLENELNHTCVAAAGTLILEFGLLSRLTGDPKFEDAAKSTIYELWRRRSPLNLVGNTINVISGEWLEGIATIGAGVDSFYEYLLKAYILFNDRDYALIFRDAYKAVMTHIKDMTGLFYKNVHFYNGGLVLSWIDSLSAFWPGLQVLLGDLDNAIKLHQMYYQIWRRYDGLPERWDFFTLSTNIPSYLLRPELIESTYFLYRSTKDPYYLLAGERFLYDIETHMKTRCGYCSIRNLFTKEKDTRMESFFLAETLKYLYLLFDTENVLNKKDSSWVFTTEAHVVWLPDELRDEIVKTGKEWNANEATKEKEVKEEPKANSKGKDSDSSSSSSSPPSAPPKQPPSPQCPVYPLSIMSAISSHPIVPFAAYLAGLNDDYDQVMCAAPAPSPSDSSSGSTPAKKKTKKKKKKKNANKSGTREKRSVEDDVDDSEINSHDDAESDENEPLNSDDAVEGESDQESNESTLNKNKWRRKWAMKVKWTKK
ncbi:glycoside hydrolase [Paraphysoderma sedebokerense]|nr:glycoside hydrolase [Paraphysoderma sedebokerense]